MKVDQACRRPCGGGDSGRAIRRRWSDERTDARSAADSKGVARSAARHRGRAAASLSARRTSRPSPGKRSPRDRRSTRGASSSSAASTTTRARAAQGPVGRARRRPIRRPGARRGGKNRFLCTTGSCAVVQATTSANKARSLTAALVTNTAKCIKTTGVTQACSISQTNATADNVAIVVEITTKASGLTQTASHTAQITQQATGASNSNTACILQDVAVDGTTSAAAKKGAPVTVTLNAHGSISVVQDAHGGPNTVKGSTAAGDCAVNSLTQKQTLTSSATGSASVAQNQNATDAGANVLLDIEQNQSTGFFGSATGSNNAAFSQTSTLSAIANTQARTSEPDAEFADRRNPGEDKSVQPRHLQRQRSPAGDAVPTRPDLRRYDLARRGHPGLLAHAEAVRTDRRRRCRPKRAGRTLQRLARGHLPARLLDSGRQPG